MHIPDGYLSPSTCASLYGAAAPFWYVALKRVRRVLNSRTVPLLALFSAFSFAIMLFNLPLPGGTTGHAVGMGIASIVLGPWVSILAISMALFIQALFFGDGGITSFGANCFNMAIVGSLTAYATYRLLSLRSGIRSSRRVLAAGFAGYVGINVAALCAAIEFGIQPALFHTAAGTPLYAPYPLSISIPAMMIGHLSFAGIAEFILTAGIVRYLQRANPEMLERTAGESKQVSSAPRKLWIGLATLVVLAPLGIISMGSAWGEWHPEDFSNVAARRQIALASHGATPPLAVPKGLSHFSHVWNAPIGNYAPRFIGSASLGYFFSASIGVLLLVAFAYVFGWFVSRSQSRRTFIERTLATVVRSVEEAIFAEEISRQNGLLQDADARAKLLGLGALIAASVAVRRFSPLLALFGLAVILGLLSRVSLKLIAFRVWLPVIAFTGFIALPSIFLVPGQAAFRIPFLRCTATQQGLSSAGFLLLRAETAATFSVLIVLCTPWNRILRSLRVLRLPTTVVLMLEMAHRYVFLFLKSARDMLEAREARRIGNLGASEERRIASATAGVLLDKTLKLSEEVYSAMRARGFRGEVYLLDDLRLTAIYGLQLTFLIALAGLAVWWGW